jgi:lipoprotein-releasing system permease protein
VRYELRIALRYLTGRRKQASISVVTAIAVLGVGLGVAALIVVTAVMSGFQAELRDRILGSNAHIIAFDRSDEPMAQYARLVEAAGRTPGVREASPFVISKAMARVGPRSEGVVIKGIDPVRARNVLSLERDLVEGSLDGLLAPKPAPDGTQVYGIVLGKELATTLGARVGLPLELLIPGAQDEAGGRDAILGSFEVCGLFESHMYEYDSTWAYTSLRGAQEFLGLGDRVSGIEISVRDIWQTRQILPELELALGTRYWLQDWQSMNASFFRALELQKWAMFLILCLIVMVAAFNVVSTLILMVMERNREIGILKALGATNAAIRRVFLYEGMIIGLAGTLLGLLAGTVTSWMADRFQLVRISGEIYYVSHLPFHLKLEDIALICACSLLISFVTTLIPSTRAGNLDPVDAIRYE